MRRKGAMAGGDRLEGSEIVTLEAMISGGATHRELSDPLGVRDRRGQELMAKMLATGKWRSLASSFSAKVGRGWRANESWPVPLSRGQDPQIP